KANGVVRLGKDGLGQIVPDFAGIDVERGDELDVVDVIPAQIDVHQTWYELVRGGVAVLGHALDEGGGAVADADDGDTHCAFFTGRSHAPSVPRQALSSKRFPLGVTIPAWP